MMTTEKINQLMKQAARLTPAERLLVARRLLEELQQEKPSRHKKVLKWRDLSGILPYPAYGEDAQTYISRIRREDSENREVGVNK
jgi:hypothetical protein